MILNTRQTVQALVMVSYGDGGRRFGRLFSRCGRRFGRRFGRHGSRWLMVVGVDCRWLMVVGVDCQVLIMVMVSGINYGDGSELQL